MHEPRIVHFDAYITHIPTGEQVVYHDTYDIDTEDVPAHCSDWKEISTFIWEDGNFRCDCNRALFFARAKGIEEEDVDCGHELYRLDKLVVRETGEIVYSEAA